MDVPDALPQLVKNGGATLEQRSAIDRRLGTMPVAFKQTHPEHMFKVGDDLRYNRFGNGEMLRRLRHALALHDCKQDM